jgi:hypothetical protein
MILVSVMLAVFLGWPLAFGGGSAPAIETGRAEARSVIAAPAQPAAATVAAVDPSAAPQAESCYKRYQREIKACTASGGAACRLKSADNWDLCEATGFWPN